MGMKKRDKVTYNVVVIGLMAAVCFATTFFFNIKIPTPAGATMLKIGNIFCLMAGMLFGGWRGGLAAGIGSFIFDLTDPLFVATSPFTLVFFFIMAFVCGTVSHIGGRCGKNVIFNALGGALGAAAYFVLNIGRSVVELVLAGSNVGAAIVSCSTRMVTSGINAVIAVIAATAITPAIRLALSKLGVFEKMGIK